MIPATGSVIVQPKRKEMTAKTQGNTGAATLKKPNTLRVKLEDRSLHSIVKRKKKMPHMPGMMLGDKMPRD